MRLLIFSTEFPPGPGGIGTHAFELARHLTRMGWEVMVLSPQDYVEEEEIRIFNAAQPFCIHPLPHFPFWWMEAVYRLWQLFRWVQRWHPDVILASGERAAWLVPPVSMVFRTPWAAVWHGILPPVKWARTLTRWAFERAGGVISVSEYSRRQLNRLNISPQMEVVITNGADVLRFQPGLEHLRLEGLPFCPAHRYLLTVGNVTERKGQEIVIRAMPHILKEVPNVRYWMAGLPTERRVLESLARELDVQEHVHFLGRVSASVLVSLYNAAEVYVMVSRHSQNGEFEGFGIAVVEAALCGKPAVVASNSGLAEAILPGETGLLVAENSPSETAQAILTLLKDEPMRKQMGQRARARALQEQTWEICASRFDHTLRALQSASHSW